MDAERVQIEIADHVADVRLTRADKHNGLDARMFAAINEAIDELRADGGVRVDRPLRRRAELLRGARLRERSRQSDGASPATLLDRAEGEVANFAQRVAYGWRQLEVPVIAALHGACFGGGLQIALGADIRIAAADTRLSVMEIALRPGRGHEPVADAAAAGRRRRRARAHLHRAGGRGARGRSSSGS